MKMKMKLNKINYSQIIFHFNNYHNNNHNKHQIQQIKSLHKKLEIANFQKKKLKKKK